jgi:hypothetical protein
LKRWLPIVLVGCGRSCSCFEGETKYESIDDPIKFQLVRETHWTGGRIPGPLSDFYVRVHTNPPIDEPAACTHVDLAENDVGTLFAFRCSARDEKGVGPWTLIRLGKSGRHFRDCTPYVGQGDKPDFSAVRPLSFAAPRILACPHSFSDVGYANRYRDLVAELRETEGSTAVVHFLIDAAGNEGDLATTVWDDQVAALSESDRAIVFRSVCPALRDPGSNEPLYVRAALHCDLSDPRVGDSALERVKNGFAAPPGFDTSFFSAAPIAMRTHPAEAAAAACANVDKLPYADLRVRVAHEAIAIGKLACPALSVVGMCDPEIECDGGTCTPAELEAELRIWIDTAALDAGARSFEDKTSDRHAALAALYAQGPLPDSVTLPNARRHYAFVNGSGPPCFDKAEAGAPCTCDFGPSKYDICNFDGGRIISSTCSFRVDDKKKTIDDVRHHCALAGVTCLADYECCMGFSCKSGETGPSKCAL